MQTATNHVFNTTKRYHQKTPQSGFLEQKNAPELPARPNLKSTSLAATR